MTKLQCTVESYYAENKPMKKYEAPSTQKEMKISNPNF
jgi:hypothetical protein